MRVVILERRVWPSSQTNKKPQDSRPCKALNQVHPHPSHHIPIPSPYPERYSLTNPLTNANNAAHSPRHHHIIPTPNLVNATLNRITYLAPYTILLLSNHGNHKVHFLESDSRQSYRCVGMALRPFLLSHANILLSRVVGWRGFIFQVAVGGAL